MSTITPSRRRAAWLGRTTAIACAAALAVGAGASLATAKQSPAPAPVTQEEVTEMMKAIYADAGDAVRYSIVLAAAEPERAWPEGSIEAQLAGAFKKMDAKRKHGYQEAAKSLLGKPSVHFGQYGKQAPAEFRGFARAYQDSPLPVDGVKLGNALKTQKLVAPQARAMPGSDGGASDALCRECDPPDCELVNCDPTPTSPKPKTGLKFMISKVVCIDETGSGVTEWGSDEIALGGVIVTPGGETVQVNAYEIPQAFDDGTVWTFYNRGHTFGSYDLPLTYPGVYTATVSLTEVDAGGFANVLNTIWQQVRATVQQKISEWVGQVLDPIVKSQLIRQALASLAGWFGVDLINWIVTSFYDDVFLQAGSSQITLNSISDTLSSGVFRFSGHDGTYDVHYYWTWRR
ncbi:hypothetical protein [Allorhizocola rhizosphaerae]|uniref:hypothetical protein n=1 Tax=Allorhizocola rhizosphaerae TaxID=1872709 RepID=UPI0013C319B5|nr:hypothetical protein [Allorhizocola rhizosphaerae]